MIVEVNHDGRLKVHSVTGGHVVKFHNMSARPTVVKVISVSLLDIIAYRVNLTVLCGNFGNAFFTYPCL